MRAWNIEIQHTRRGSGHASTQHKGPKTKLTQEVIYSCMKITSTSATPRILASRKFPMKLLCKIAGADRVDGTYTLFFINKNNIPKNCQREVTYGRIVCDVREGKSDKKRTILTVGGNRINYTGDLGTPTACLLTVKILVNSVVSTAGAEFMTLDIILLLSEHPIGEVRIPEAKIIQLT